MSDMEKLLYSMFQSSDNLDLITGQQTYLGDELYKCSVYDFLSSSWQGMRNGSFQLCL